MLERCSRDERAEAPRLGSIVANADQTADGDQRTFDAAKA